MSFRMGTYNLIPIEVMVNTALDFPPNRHVAICRRQKSNTIGSSDWPGCGAVSSGSPGWGARHRGNRGR